MCRFGKLANLPDPLLYYRIHNKQVTSLFLETQRYNSTEITFQFLKTIGITIDKSKIQYLRIICYEEKCDSIKGLCEVERLIFQIINKAHNAKIDFV